MTEEPPVTLNMGIGLMGTKQLKSFQEAGERAEARMLEFLLQFIPASELKVSDVKCIAQHARSITFDEFINACPGVYEKSA